MQKEKNLYQFGSHREETDGQFSSARLILTPPDILEALTQDSQSHPSSSNSAKSQLRTSVRENNPLAPTLTL